VLPRSPGKQQQPLLATVPLHIAAAAKRRATQPRNRNDTQNALADLSPMNEEEEFLISIESFTWNVEKNFLKKKQESWRHVQAVADT